MELIFGVVSDTHLDEADEELYFLNNVVFKDVSTVIHLGDIVKLGVLDAFFDKKIYAVSGNMDGIDVRKKFPFIEKINISGINTLLLHSDGYGSDLFNSLIKEFSDFNLFLYGHTHKPLINKIGKYVFFNPGSFSRNRVNNPVRSVGLIYLDDEKAAFQIVDIGEISYKNFKIKEVFNVRRSKGNFI
ncbi:MAG: YfcE family phosphodiesterase [Desulforegulaceae bacterium]|nr:YfcE family phosphodiesterase [Desulforegulaceae bacterium]